MAFDARDATVQLPAHAVDTTVEEVRFVRSRDLAGAKLEILVLKRVDGRRRVFKVPQATVNAAWASGVTRTLPNTLLAIIDAAV